MEKRKCNRLYVVPWGDGKPGGFAIVANNNGIVVVAHVDADGYYIEDELFNGNSAFIADIEESNSNYAKSSSEATLKDFSK